VTALTHSVTGHRISTDDESVEFWEAAGYRVEKAKAPAKKAAAKKSSTTKK
jgi:hypothetical protein